MAGIFCGDITISNCLRKSIEDLRLNPWILDHIFSSINDQNEISNAKKFFLENQFPVLLSHRIDSPTAMFISLTLGSSKEMKEMAFLGDMTNEVVDYKPNEIGKPIPFIIKTFTIVSYDPTTGIVTMPEMIEYKYLNAGMLSVDPSTGDAANIIEVLGSNQYLIAKNLTISNEQAIIPQYPLYRARLESASFSEDYTIGIHCSGDPLWAIYLHSIVSYSLLRYRESLLEREGFQISSISSSDYSKNAQYESIGEHIYSRYITLTGQVQNNWVKAPQRFVESIVFQDPNSIDPAGIKIISSNRLPGADSQNDLWSSVSDNDDSINDNDDDDPFWKS